MAQFELDLEVQGELSQIPSCPKLLKLFVVAQRTAFDVEPEDYLTASAELLVLTICVSYALTFFLNREMLDDNPIRNMLGYNNPCVFWDEPPALYLACFMFSPMVYLAIRYAHLDTARARLRPSVQGREVVYRIINWAYACSQIFLMGIFVVRPLRGKLTKNASLQDMHWHMRVHATCFVQFVPVLCLALAANYVEGYLSGNPRSQPSPRAWAALAIYVVASVLESTCLPYAIFCYEGDYRKEEREKYFKLNPWFLMGVDYAWFISLPLAGSMQPPAPNLQYHYQLEPDYCAAPQVIGRPTADDKLPASVEACGILARSESLGSKMDEERGREPRRQGTASGLTE